MIEREATCAFTGHRESKLPWHGDEADPRCQRLKRCIFDAAEALYINEGVTHFICGMASGADLYFCEAIIALREEHPEITLEAAIPCEEQAAKWTPEQKAPPVLPSRGQRSIQRCSKALSMNFAISGVNLPISRISVSRASSMVKVLLLFPTGAKRS